MTYYPDLTLPAEAADLFKRGREIDGLEIDDLIRAELCAALAGDYDHLYGFNSANGERWYKKAAHYRKLAAEAL